jgi:DNA-binding SARP family transcriptional activator
MTTLALYLLGAPRLERDGVVVHVARRKALALLAYLAATRQPQSRNLLAALLWPDLSQSQARTAMRSVLVALTHALGPGRLAATPDEIRLVEAQGLWVDVHEFERRRAQVAAHHPRAGPAPGILCNGCLAALGEAATLAQREFLTGSSLPDAPEFELWQTAQAERLRQALSGVLAQLVAGHVRRGEHAYARALGYAQQWVALDPLHEPAQRALMCVYGWRGERTAALQQYATWRRLLASELGVQPEAATVELAERIRTGTLAAPEADVGAALTVPASARPPALPVPPTPFVGRVAELAQVAELLRDPSCRLLTIVGPGGSGKTRLALQAAQAQVERFAQGVVWVDLAAVSRPEELALALLRSLQAPEQGAADAGQRLCDYLADKQLLLLLDNAEH